MKRKSVSQSPKIDSPAKRKKKLISDDEEEEGQDSETGVEEIKQDDIEMKVGFVTHMSLNIVLC